MDIADRTELAWIGMDNVSDMDTSRTQYAKAAAEALGWISVKKELPTFNDAVVCTDGKHRWLDMRIAGLENLIWQGHLATHWHPLADLPEVSITSGFQK
jgi:hypothetical protein